MSKRTFWSKLNHDDARLAIDMMDDAEIGRWFRGWLSGAGGKEYSEDKVQSWPLEMRTGFAAGKESFADAERYSQKQRDRINKRYQGNTTEHHGATTVDSGIENATESLPSNSQQPTANSQQPEANNEQLGARSTERFIPPTLEEWVQYCTTKWTDWHTSSAESSWHYYDSVDWKRGKQKMSKWRSAAATSYKKHAEWNTLQPKGVPPKPAPITVSPEIRERELRLREQYKTERPF